MDDLLEKDQKRDREERKRDVLALKNPEIRKKFRKYDRLQHRASTKDVKDKKLLNLLKKESKRAEHAATKAARSELLLLEDPGYVLYLDTLLRGRPV